MLFASWIPEVIRVVECRSWAKRSRCFRCQVSKCLPLSPCGVWCCFVYPVPFSSAPDAGVNICKSTNQSTITKSRCNFANLLLLDPSLSKLPEPPEPTQIRLLSSEIRRIAVTLLFRLVQKIDEPTWQLLAQIRHFDKWSHVDGGGSLFLLA